MEPANFWKKQGPAKGGILISSAISMYYGILRKMA
jgi:hypothetical protein